MENNRRKLFPAKVAAAAAAAVQLTFQEKMLAGAIARCVAQTVLHPIDVLRTRLQAKNVGSVFNASVFVKGIIPQITLAIPAGAIQFLAFESAKEKLTKLIPDEKFSQTRILLAGALGALVAASCRVPQEVLKQRIQAGIYPDMAVALRETVGKHGLGALYKGSVATISRDVPWNALSFMFHGQGKKIFKNSRGRDPANDENLAIAGVAGAIAAVIMTPIDVVKTRIMTQQAGSTVYKGVMSTFQTIVREEGAGTLMKGVIPRIVFLAPLAGITFSVYEAVAANIKKRKSQPPEPVAHDPRHHSSPSYASEENAGNLRRRKIALHFSKSPVKLAAFNSSRRGTSLGDYDSPSPFVFTLSA
ncbi:putative S-adenosylmethionine carrier 2, chloroplastic [Gracilariopsis chorda]|uniref:Putative S-adenosylmethionine carrier 2, chloroplastic n=1 Tax=Gracilariopsis chorda TaxID=448386 RepID=A0A2V3IU63_9FLOR|nr:putative S-adenosylmethionine carrier 2, chloroplastic [Gracilariopsis chorda]|eukprot:PXF45645.1 putative S-adenosylmethionine carrier 2, chloroplastic [Gracilariopsis chorda]